MIMKSGSLDMGSIRFRQMSPFVEYSIDGIPRYSKPADAKKEAEGRFYTLFGYAKRKKYVFYNDDIVLMLAIDYLESGNGTIINVTVKNNGESDIRLKKIGLASINHVDYMGNADEWVLSGVSDTSVNADLTETLSNVKGRNSLRRYKDIVSLCSADGSGVIMGACGRPEAELIFDCDVINGTISINIYSDMSSVTVESGETRDAQSVVIMQGDHIDCVEKISDAMVKTHGSRVSKKPICSWTSKYCMGNTVDSDSVVGASDAIAMQGLNESLNMVEINDGYQKKYGEWSENESFGKTLAECVKHIKANNLIAGVRIAPLYVDDSLGMYEKCPEMFQRDKNGKRTSVICDSHGNKCSALDPTHPESVKYITNVIKQKADEGFEYLKISLNHIGPKTRFYDKHKTGLQVMRNLYKLYRSICGENTYIMAETNSFSRAVIGYADICRCGTDSCPEWTPDKKTGAIWNNENGADIENAIRSCGSISVMNGKFFANDADIIFMENTAFENKKAKKTATTKEEIITWNSFAGISGSCVSMSHPIWDNNVKTDRKLIDIMTPPYTAGAFCARSGFDTDCTQYGYYWDRSFGISSSFMVWNNSDRAKKINIRKAHTTSLGGEYHLWSFWDGKYIGKGQENAEKISLKPHECRLFKATVISDDMAPAFIGSTLHISMGAAEVDKYIFGKGGCKFILNTNGSESGELYVFSKKPLHITETKNIKAEISSVQKNVYKISVSGRSKEKCQVVEMKYKF